MPLKLCMWYSSLIKKSLEASFAYHWRDGGRILAWYKIERSKLPVQAQFYFNLSCVEYIKLVFIFGVLHQQSWKAAFLNNCGKCFPSKYKFFYIYGYPRTGLGGYSVNWQKGASVDNDVSINPFLSLSFFFCVVVFGQ